jgi:FkbM family methyltransferase
MSTRTALPTRVRRKLSTVRARGRTDAVSEILAVFGRAHPDAVFVQIGANDGQQRDPLRANIEHHAWSGVMVEPVPYVFARLESHYRGHDRVRLVNVAIADEDGTRTLFYLPQSDDKGLPPWYDALASFRPDVLLSHENFIPDVAARVATMEVPCWTFDTLCRNEGIGRIDVIQIDTEGYDHEVIKTIDLDRHRPSLLMYESLHLSPEERAACTAHLQRHGYEWMTDGMDTVCLQRAALGPRPSRLHRTWRRLQHGQHP